MVRREIRYITLFDGEADKQIFAFEVGISLTNDDGKNVRDALFSALKTELPQFSDKDINTAINDYAYTGIADLDGYVISGDDIVCYTFD
jgi:hypothetical protein